MPAHRAPATTEEVPLNYPEGYARKGTDQPKKTLLVVRHCQAQGQDPDASLTRDGWKQAEQLAAFLGRWPVERIVSSPFARALQSAAPLAELKDLSVETDARLVERTLGSPTPDWLDQLRATFDDLDLRFPGGESSRDAMERARSAVDDILQHGVDTTVVVTHGNLLTLLLKHFDERIGFAEWCALTNPDVYEIIIGAEGSSVTRGWQDEMQH